MLKIHAGVLVISVADDTPKQHLQGAASSIFECVLVCQLGLFHGESRLEGIECMFRPICQGLIAQEMSRQWCETALIGGVT